MDDTWNRLKKLRTAQRQLALAEAARCRCEMERFALATAQAQAQVQVRREIRIEHELAARQAFEAGGWSIIQLSCAAAWRGALDTRIIQARQQAEEAGRAAAAHQLQLDERQQRARQAHAAVEKATKLELRQLAEHLRLSELRSEEQQDEARRPGQAALASFALRRQTQRSDRL